MKCEAAAAEANALTSEAVKSAALPLQSVHHVHGRHGLTTGVLGIRDGIADDILQKDLENATSLLVNKAADTLHTATARETTNSGLGDALDVVAQHLAMALGAALAQALAALPTPRHSDSDSSGSRTQEAERTRERKSERAERKPLNSDCGETQRE